MFTLITEKQHEQTVRRRELHTFFHLLYYSWISIRDI